MQEFEEDQLEPLTLDDGLVLPCLRLTLEEQPPFSQVKVGEQAYQYARSVPIKGYGATLPGYAREQMGEGRKLLLIERPTRYLVYLSA